MIRAIIIDDEHPAIEVVKSLLKNYNDSIFVCSTCQNITDAINDIARYSPDIIFLDVEMGSNSAFEILEQIPGLKSHIIFITAYEQYALKALKIHAYDYILKPVDPEEFYHTLDSVLNKMNFNFSHENHSSSLLNPAKKLAIPNKNGYEYYNQNDIVLLEAAGSYTQVYLNDNTHILISKGLHKIENAIIDSGFLRVHRSFIVNLHHIKSSRKDDSGHLVMSNGKNVPIGNAHREQVISVLKMFSLHL